MKVMTANIKAVDAYLIRRQFIVKGAANVGTVFALAQSRSTTSCIS